MKHKETGFEHLHRHSDFSLLDGFATVEEYAQRMVEINQKYLCITDHGVLGAVPQQVKCADRYDLYPIFGIEFYINPLQPKVETRAESAKFYAQLGPTGGKERTPEQNIFRTSYHLLAIAYNEVGYSNLVALSSWAWRHGFYYKPRINHEILKQHSEGIIFTSGCGNSEIARAFFAGGDEAGFKKLEEYLELVGRNNFYLELMMLDWKLQRDYDKFLQRAHDKYGLPVIITQDCHYCRKEHSHNQRLMLMQQKKITIKEVEKMVAQGQDDDIFVLQDTQLWLKSEEEMDQMWEEKYSDVIDYDIYVQAKENVIRICQQAQGVQLDRDIKLPVIENADEKLWEEIVKGMKQRCPNEKVYWNRVKSEYDLIRRKGFSSYFLIQKEMVDEARRVGPKILGYGDGSECVGPGRGCVSAGTLIYINGGRTVPIEQINIGDEVLTSNGRLNYVLDLFEYPIKPSEVMVQISCYGDSDKHRFWLTSDHRVLCLKQNEIKEDNLNSLSSSDLSWVRADKVNVGDYVFIPCDRTEYYDEAYLREWHTSSIQSENSLNDFYTAISAFVLFGRYNGMEKVSLVFRDGLSDFAMKKCILALSRLGVDVTAIQNGDIKKIYCSGPFISKFVIPKVFGIRRDKYYPHYIPFEIMANGANVKEDFVNSLYELCNLAKNNSNSLICFHSYELAFQWKYLLAALGRFAKIIVMPDDKVVAEEDKRYGSHVVNIQDGMLVNVTNIDYKTCESLGIEYVYDLAVADYRNYTTGSFLIHNSVCGSLVAYCLRLHDIDPIKHDLKFSRFLSEARGGKQMKIRFTIDPVTRQN